MQAGFRNTFVSKVCSKSVINPALNVPAHNLSVSLHYLVKCLAAFFRLTVANGTTSRIAVDRSHDDFVIRRAELTASVTGLTNCAHSTRSVLPASVPCVHDPSISLVHGAHIVTSGYDFVTRNRE